MLAIAPYPNLKERVKLCSLSPGCSQLWVANWPRSQLKASCLFNPVVLDLVGIQLARNLRDPFLVAFMWQHAGAQVIDTRFEFGPIGSISPPLLTRILSACYMLQHISQQHCLAAKEITSLLEGVFRHFEMNRLRSGFTLLAWGILAELVGSREFWTPA